MGGGRRLPGEFSSSSTISSDEEDDYNSSISSSTHLPNSPRSRPCDACTTAYARARAVLSSREAIRRYKPGDFMGGGGDGGESGNFEVPDATTVLLLGGSGEGKSALVGGMKRVFEDGWDSSIAGVVPVEVADSDSLQEHMILKDSTSVCVFDTPGWSLNPEDNYKTFQRWIENGVCHGEFEYSDSVDGNRKENGNSSVLKECESRLNKKRMVNHVIIVVDAISIQKSIDTQDSQYLDMVYATFNYPFLTFKGIKPTVVVTNGDQLSSIKLSHVLKATEGLLGIPPSHIFNISDNYHAELDILNLLRHCLEKADRGLPLKRKSPQEKHEVRHAISKLDSCSDLAIDIFIFYLCILVLVGSWMGYAFIRSS